MKDVYNLTSKLSEEEQKDVWDYFNFKVEVFNSFSENKLSRLIGYPTTEYNNEVLSNTNDKTKATIKEIEPLVDKFVNNNNKLTLNSEFVPNEVTEILNDVLKQIPELYSAIGRKQHGTHSYTIDVHSLAVLQECIKNKEFTNLDLDEKRTLILASLLHDISKTEYQVDKQHPENSYKIAKSVLKRTNLPEKIQNNVCTLIRNHNMLEICNKSIDKDAAIDNYARELSSDNLTLLEIIFTQSDLLSVRSDGSFFTRFKDGFDYVKEKLCPNYDYC